MTDEATSRTFKNIRDVMIEFGASKISALPTISPQWLDRIEEVVDAHLEMGFTSIYLRPVHYHGFARKKFGGTRSETAEWAAAYARALDYIVSLNASGEAQIIEYNLELALSRIFRRGFNGHVDLRSPNFAASDYIVVDFDGRLYPTDEARMLARIGATGLSIGSLRDGMNPDAVRSYNWNQINDVHEDCIHCAFQAYCGIDTIDDLARYGRADIPKSKTWFCQWHTFLFDKVFELLATMRPDVIACFNLHLGGPCTVEPFFGQIFYDPAELSN